MYSTLPTALGEQCSARPSRVNVQNEQESLILGPFIPCFSGPTVVSLPLNGENTWHFLTSPRRANLALLASTLSICSEVLKRSDHG